MFGDSSQMFAEASQAPTQGGSPSKAAPGGKGRQDEKQSCLPVTVRLLETALAKVSGNSELSIHGTEPAFVVLVGVVEALTRQATGLEFSINDATGRIRVRYFTSDVAVLEAIVAGTYVTVVGVARSSPTSHVSAQWVHPCASADQISYHAIEVAHAALRLQKGVREPVLAPSSTSVIAPAPREVSASQAVADGYPSPPVQTPQTVATPARAASAAEMTQKPPEGPALKTAVLAALKAAGDKPEGLPFAELMKELPTTTQESTLRSALTTLIDTGDVYNTLDEEHFALL